ncbi:Rap/ran-GAP [Carpediemonas membranifera]|uniref:Rap/ran-GAP n=1 Tax=Carpediemonas membranifera TaxID=201153 RepID=A0A8J6E2K6_9EUKA|nr:Rap/ran-GAP [Carpediemonas membranifera]|eukprot:KAG9392017.1 Rap/ran-GAP [Carpediemonas membranifera]
MSASIELKHGWKRDITPVDAVIPDIQAQVLVDDIPEAVSRAYQLNFADDHKNYITYLEDFEDDIANPLVASISLGVAPTDVPADSSSESDEEIAPMYQYNVLLRDANSTELFHALEDAVMVPWWRKLFCLGASRSSILRAAVGSDFWNDIDLSSTSWHSLPHTQPVIDQLVHFESIQIDKQRHHTVGVLLQLPGQTTEEEMFSNQEITPEFGRFLGALGDTVDLLGWGDYAGGLNTAKGYTGDQSVFIDHRGHKVMYHVANMLPYSKSNPQQIERKRFIGNDHVVVIFQDGRGEMPFATNTIRTNMTMAYVVVRRAPEDEDTDPEDPLYTMDVATMKYVPQSRPVLGEGNRFRLSDSKAVELIRTKLVNLSNGVWRDGVLAGKLQKMKAVNLAKADNIHEDS